MPWFPDFVAAAELARRETRAAGQADPVGEYFAALTSGSTRELETVWPGEVVIDDPRAGQLHGHRQVRHFVRENHARWAARHARVETKASTSGRGRAVVELLVHLPDEDAIEGDGEGGGGEIRWPIAVVAESHDDRSIGFRTYCSQVPVDGHRHLRSPILEPGPADPGEAVGRFLVALDGGDVDAIVGTFAPDGYFRESIGSDDRHAGPDDLRALFSRWCDGGGIGLERCVVTDDGVRVALEYNCVRWGSSEIPPQAGIVVFERGADGLLAAARVYDDVEPPVGPADDLR